MGNADTKLNFRKAVIQLTSKTQDFCSKEPIDASDDLFWDQFWNENVTSVQDVFTLVPATEIRALREEAPSNLATLCYKAVEKLVRAVDSSCRTHQEQQTGFEEVHLQFLLSHFFLVWSTRSLWSTLGQSKAHYCFLSGVFSPKPKWSSY
ncbi:hypothetical protein AAG570_010299 [Ranatra chinensis]|uniref:Uncharacterized protein n=1 Tax=Ranatra chinensis TaxID=642074 RepID=A0ABD0Z496_9HEMI